jgi:hypothetical protein
MDKRINLDEKSVRNGNRRISTSHIRNMMFSEVKRGYNTGIVTLGICGFHKNRLYSGLFGYLMFRENRLKVDYRLSR